MMQPVGGMGRIGEAFGAKLGNAITYGAEVRALRRIGNGARVVWRDAAGREHAIEAPLVVVTIPLPVLRDDRRRLLARRSRRHRSGGLRAGGQDRLPGRAAVLGTGRCDLRRHLVDHARYHPGLVPLGRHPPAEGHPGRRLYLVGRRSGEKFAAMSPAARLEAALADGERLHPDYRRHLTKGVSVAWKNIPFSCRPGRSGAATRARHITARC